MHFFANLGGGGTPLLDRLRVFTRIVGGAMLVWAPIWAAAAWRAGRGWRRFLLGLALPAAALLAAVDLHDVTVRYEVANVIVDNVHLAQIALFIASGLLLAVVVIVSPIRLGEQDAGDRARFALATWMGTTTIFNLVATSPIAFGAVRHLLLVLIPLLLLCGGAFDRAAGSVARFAAWVALVLGAGLGGLLAHGDRLAARAGIEAAAAIRFLVSEGKQVWTYGDPALRYYAEPLGGHWWRGGVEEIPVGGTLVFLHSRGIVHLQHPFFSKYARRVAREWLESWNPLRTQTDHASFYAGNVLTIPWMAEMYERGPKGEWLYDELYVYERIR
jgi:hypothetical protein